MGSSLSLFSFFAFINSEAKQYKIKVYLFVTSFQAANDVELSAIEKNGNIRNRKPVWEYKFRCRAHDQLSKKNFRFGLIEFGVD